MKAIAPVIAEESGNRWRVKFLISVASQRVKSWAIHLLARYSDVQSTRMLFCIPLFWLFFHTPWRFDILLVRKDKKPVPGDGVTSFSTFSLIISCLCSSPNDVLLCKMPCLFAFFCVCRPFWQCYKSMQANVRSSPLQPSTTVLCHRLAAHRTGAWLSASPTDHCYTSACHSGRNTQAEESASSCTS